jgi:hypothetical protein
MKYIYFYFTRLKQYFLSNKLIFILYVIGSFTSAIVVIYTYTNLIAYNRVVLDNDVYNYYINSDYGYKINENVEKLNEFINEEKELLWATLSIDFDVTEKSDLFLNENIYIATSLNDDFNWQHSGRIEFNEDEKNGYVKSIILPINSINPLIINDIIGKKITIFGEEFTIIGLHDYYISYIIIPYKIYNNLNLNFKNVNICFDKPLEESSILKFNNIIKDYFHKSNVKMPNTPDDYYRNSFFGNMIGILIIYLISMISFVFLFKFLLESRNYENLILSLCGASKRKISLFVLMDNIILNSLVIIGAIFFYSIFKRSLFDYISLKGIALFISDYLIIFLSLMITGLLITVPFLIKFYNNDLMDLKKYYTK